jgi:hypothetical protein
MIGRLRRRVAAVGLLFALLGAMGACKIGTSSAGASPAPTISPAPSVEPPPPASMAGGACLLMDFDTINSDLGTAFGVSAAADSDGTYTCVIQATAATNPNLTISITATTLTTVDFTATIQPAGATAVTKLGKIGYIQQIKAVAPAGPAVEVGWLSGNERLIIMRYTFAANGTAAQATALATGMAKLARTVDATTV